MNRPTISIGTMLAAGALCAGLLACNSASESDDGPWQKARLAGATNGDRACYLELTHAGKSWQQPALFELCEPAAALKGEHVRYRTRPEKLQSPACEGDPQCKQSVIEQVVFELEATGD